MSSEAVIYRGLMALAVGLGAVLGLAGIFLIDRLRTRRRRLSIEHEVRRLGTDVNDLRYQVQQLRIAGGSKKTKPATRNTQSTSSEVETDVETLVSAFETAEDDDEFYDTFDNESEAGDLRLAQLLREVDRLLRGSAEDQQMAFGLLQEHYDQYSDHPEVLWRFAEASHAVAAALDDSITPERKKDIIEKGCEYAEQALKLNPSSYEAHKWYAINVGTRGQLSTLTQKISDGLLFKKHIDEALKLKSTDGSLHHLLGRYNFEVASLSWLERSVASNVFKVPSASFTDALQYFLNAERLISPPWKENRLFIARCYESLGNVQLTVEWLEKAEIVECITSSDEVAEKTLQDLLTKYASLLRNRRRQE